MKNKLDTVRTRRESKKDSTTKVKGLANSWANRARQNMHSIQETNHLNSPRKKAQVDDENSSTSGYNTTSLKE